MALGLIIYLLPVDLPLGRISELDGAVIAFQQDRIVAMIGKRLLARALNRQRLIKDRKPSVAWLILPGHRNPGRSSPQRVLPIQIQQLRNERLLAIIEGVVTSADSGLFLPFTPPLAAWSSGILTVTALVG